MTESLLSSMSLRGLSDPRFGQARPPLTFAVSPPLHERDTLMASLLERVLDEIDYGVLIVAPGRQVVFVNRAARALLNDVPTLCHVDGGVLRAQTVADQSALDKALDTAAFHARRSLVRVGHDEQAMLLAVVPLSGGLVGTGQPELLHRSAADHRHGAEDVLLLFSRRQMCEALSVEFYARAHGLTHAESMVLGGLCRGEQPNAIATELGVAISTVRTQVSCIRQKTGAASIRELVQQVAVLPPIVSAVHSWGANAH